MLKSLIKPFFTWYINTIIHKDFSSFSYNCIDFNSNRSILLIANHSSWWDGFLMFQLNRLYFKKNFHVMVTEENYKEVSFLKYLGAFPVKRNSKSVVESLKYAADLLNDKNNLVLIFPQGKLYSSYITDVEFEKGLIHLVNSSHKEFQYIFSSILVDYYDKRKPTVTCYLKTHEGTEFNDLPAIKNAYNQHYETSRLQQSRIIV